MADYFHKYPPPQSQKSYCVILRGRIKEAACTLRKQDPTLPENRALNRCEARFNLVWNLQLTQHNFACTWTVQDTWTVTIYDTKSMVKQQSQGIKWHAYTSYSAKSRHMQIC